MLSIADYLELRKRSRRFAKIPSQSFLAIHLDFHLLVYLVLKNKKRAAVALGF